MYSAHFHGHCHLGTGFSCFTLGQSFASHAFMPYFFHGTSMPYHIFLPFFHHFSTIFPRCSKMWVCLKIGYIPNYSHLIGILIINHWVWGYTIFRHTHVPRFPGGGVQPVQARHQLGAGRHPRRLGQPSSGDPNLGGAVGIWSKARSIQILSLNSGKRFSIYSDILYIYIFMTSPHLSYILGKKSSIWLWVYES